MTDEKRLWYWLSEILEDPEVAKPPAEIVPGLAWAERVTLLAAREKAGKSTLVGAAAAALSSGGTFLGNRLEPRNVLWVSLEEHMSEISRRFVHFGGDPARLAICNAFMDPFKELPGICLETEPDLVVMDTLGAFADAALREPIDPADSAAWTRIVRWLTSLARDLPTSMLLLHHARKSDGRYRDSSAIGANVDVILEMSGEGHDPRAIRGVGRWMIPDLRVKLEDGHFQIARPRDAIQDAVLHFVKANPGCSWQQLRTTMQGRMETIRDARDTLLASGAILNVGTEEKHAYRAA